MEAEGGRLAHERLHHHQPHAHQLDLPSSLLPGGGILNLDIVRALHQTVISLRSALDLSRAELRRLREIVGDFRGKNYAEAIERLSLENYILRRRILSSNKQQQQQHYHLNDVNPEPSTTTTTSRIEIDSSFKSLFLINKNLLDRQTEAMEEAENATTLAVGFETNEEIETLNNPPEVVTGGGVVVVVAAAGALEQAISKTTSTQDLLEGPDKDFEDSSIRSVSDGGGDNSVFSDCNPDCSNPQQQQQLTSEMKHAESENDSEELDDIELIFTTDETCSRDVALQQEDLVSITDTENWLNTTTTGDTSHTVFKVSSSVFNGEKTGTSSVEEALSSQSSSIDREESVDRFDESSSSRLNKIWSQCSVLVETDISKCGVVEETAENTAIRHNAIRRNTLAAPPTAAYRPIIHREAITAAAAVANRRKSSTPLRPVMDRSCGSGARRESGAQTDISALPAQWRSESYLAHKVAHTFTTLPSKFALPAAGIAAAAGRLRISDKKGSEARRVLLSDISFTSMVPELSRSADHLCHDVHNQNCFNSRGGGGGGVGGGGGSGGPRTLDINRRSNTAGGGGGGGGAAAAGGLPSPCDCRLSTDHLYSSSRYRGSLTSIPSPTAVLETVIVGGQPPRRHSWRANAASFDTWKVPAATCSTIKPSWSSMPSSPTHINPLNSGGGGGGDGGGGNSSRCMKNPAKRTRSKVTFQECQIIRGSLPNLPSELITSENSGGDDDDDSTESLIDEAEDYLRRSIDSMLNISSSDYWNRQTTTTTTATTTTRQRRARRRHSEPDLFREWNPSQDARPYLPKIPHDLKLDHLVKVISPEGRVLQGKVRYIGPVPGREEVHIGVELPIDSAAVAGYSDGTFHGRRFFNCHQNRAIFVPFKKVVLAWCTT